MAEFDFKRVRLLPGFTPRKVTLPATGVAIDEYGGRSFELRASKGVIVVAMTWCGWECRGRKEALIDYGLISEDWLPGAPGNNKTMQIVLFMPDGQVALGSWPGGRPRGYPSLNIVRHSGETFTVGLPYTEEERAEDDNFRDTWKEQQTREEAARVAQGTWAKAQKAHNPEEDFATRWRSGVNQKLQEVAQLLDGSAVFNGFPYFRLIGVELDEAREAIAKLERLISRSKPTIPVIKVRENVIGLDGRAYRHM